MRQAFPYSHEIDDKVDSVIGFIKCCLVIVPEKRPGIELLQKHELFGGSFKNIELEHNEDIWCKTIDVPGVDTNFHLNNLEDESEQFNECNITQCRKTYSVNSSREELDEKANHSQLNQTNLIYNNGKGNEFKEDQLDRFNKTYIVSNKKEIVDLKNTPNNETNKLLTNEGPLRATTEESHEISFEKSNLNDESQPSENNQFQSSSLDRTVSSSNDPDEVVTCEVENVSQFTSDKTRFQKFRRWWRNQKRSFSRIINACISCGR